MPTLDEAHLAPTIRHVLDAIGIGIWMVDGNGRLLLANRRAWHTMEEATTVRVSADHVAAAISTQQGFLQRALASAVVGRRSMLLLGSGDRTRPFAVVPMRHDEDGRAAPVLLLSGERASAEPIAMTLFAKALKLTTSERDVLTCLCDGLAAQEIASMRSVRLTTVRTQIASLREKVGVHSVQALVARALALPPMSTRSPRMSL